MPQTEHLLTILHRLAPGSALSSADICALSDDHEELEHALAAVLGGPPSPHRIGRLFSRCYDGLGKQWLIDDRGEALPLGKHPTLVVIVAGVDSHSKSKQWKVVTYESLRPKPPQASTPGANCGVLLRGPRDSIDDSRAWRHHPTLIQVRDHLANAGLPALLCPAGIALPGIALEDERITEYIGPFGGELVEFAPRPGSIRGDAIAAPDLSLVQPGLRPEICGSERAALFAALNPPTQPRGYMTPQKFFPNGW